MHYTSIFTTTRTITEGVLRVRRPREDHEFSVVIAMPYVALVVGFVALILKNSA